MDTDTDMKKTMISTFVVRQEHGEREYTGHVSSRSPHTIVVLLTKPYSAAGQVVKIPTCDVISEQNAA